MSYYQVPCSAHGRYNCPCSESQWQQSGPSTAPNSSRTPSDRNRRQLQQRFDDLHMGAFNKARMIFNYQVLDTSDPKLGATISAINTLCISQIATTFNDQGLMLNARVMYGKTENYLHMRLEVIASGQPDRTALQDTVGAVHTLTACSWLNCLETNGTKWMRHTHALLKILEVDGWESLNPSTNRSFYYGWKHRAFFESLIGKKALPLREPKSAKITSLPRALVMEHALEVPGIFWRSEKIHQQAHTKTIPRRIVTAVLTELEKSISKLKQWHLQWTKSFGPKPHYRTISVKAFRHFSALSGDQLAVFPMAYDFSHPQHEGDFRMLCICLLHLDLAIMNIDHAFPEFCIGNEFQLQLRSADYDAETCTADLCMLISWTTQPENMAFASIHAQRPLFYALKYYQSQGKEPQLTWSQTVLQSLKEKYGIEIKFPD